MTKERRRLDAGGEFVDSDDENFEEHLFISDPLEGCEASDSCESKTKFVQGHFLPVESGDGEDGIVLCDTPGFGDTEGEAADIANAVSITSAIRSCSAAKLILLVRGVDIVASGDRGTALLKLFSLMKRLIAG